MEVSANAAETADYIQSETELWTRRYCIRKGSKADLTRQWLNSNGHESGLHAVVGEANLTAKAAAPRERSHSRHRAYTLWLGRPT